MRFFELDDDKTVQLNKVWIQMIPEFKALLTRDKGSKGDYDGRHKLKARQDFTFIYFFMDFNSPIRDWEPEERQREACYYAGLEEKDVAKDDELWVALNKYEQLLLKASRSLKTYRSLLKMKDEMDSYYENVSFTAKDKMGRLLNDPDTVGKSVERLSKVDDAIKKYGKAVEDELKEGGSKIRGTAEKGENEDKVRKWSEGDIAASSRRLQPAAAKLDMKKLSQMVKAAAPASSVFEEDDNGELPQESNEYEVL